MPESQIAKMKIRRPQVLRARVIEHLIETQSLSHVIHRRTCLHPFMGLSMRARAGSYVSQCHREVRRSSIIFIPYLRRSGGYRKFSPQVGALVEFLRTIFMRTPQQIRWRSIAFRATQACALSIIAHHREVSWRFPLTHGLSLICPGRSMDNHSSDSSPRTLKLKFNTSTRIGWK
jgi:hypothetical protein